MFSLLSGMKEVEGWDKFAAWVRRPQHRYRFHGFASAGEKTVARASTTVAHVRSTP